MKAFRESGDSADLKIEAGILGATGIVGQHLVRLLENHPWFELKWVAASDRSAGKPYEDAASWRLAWPMPDAVRKLRVEECKAGRDRKSVV